MLKWFEFRAGVAAGYKKFFFLISLLHVPSATKYANKLQEKILQSKIEQVSWRGKYRVARDKSEFQLIKFDFATGCQEIKISIVIRFEIFSSLCVFFFVNISWLSPFLAFYMYFALQHNKAR